MIMAVLFTVAVLLGEYLSRDFFLPQNTFATGRETILRKTKNPLGCEWVGIFFVTAVITNSPLAPYSGGTQNRNQYE
jgi:hypothetical protein